MFGEKILGKIKINGVDKTFYVNTDIGKLTDISLNNKCEVEVVSNNCELAQMLINSDVNEVFATLRSIA